MVQRRAGRFTLNRYHNTSSLTSMLDELNWETLEGSNFNSPTCIRSNITLLMQKHPSTFPNGQHQSDQSTLHSSTSTNHLLTSSSLASSREQLYIATVYQPQWLRLTPWHNSKGHPTLLMGISSSRGISLGLLSYAAGTRPWYCNAGRRGQSTGPDEVSQRSKLVPWFNQFMYYWQHF